MILNRLIFPEGNKIIFNIEHNENNEKYNLNQGENYYLMISQPVEPFAVLGSFSSDSSHFEVEASLEDGEYVFEVGITDAVGDRRVILPALDERYRPMNQLLILRRLEK